MGGKGEFSEVKYKINAEDENESICLNNYQMNLNNDYQQNS